MKKRKDRKWSQAASSSFTVVATTWGKKKTRKGMEKRSCRRQFRKREEHDQQTENYFITPILFRFTNLQDLQQHHASGFDRVRVVEVVELELL